MRDGAEMSTVGVEGVEGMRSQIVGAMSSKPRMAILLLTIVRLSERLDVENLKPGGLTQCLGMQVTLEPGVLILYLTITETRAYI